MRRAFISSLGLLCFVVLSLVSSAQQTPGATEAYQRRCGACHGATMAGGSGPAILSYIRYHTDSDIRAMLGEKHRNLALPEDEQRQVLADLRVLAGTNPAMATGGYTGQRGGGAGGARGRGAAAAPPAAASAAGTAAA